VGLHLTVLKAENLAAPGCPSEQVPDAGSSRFIVALLLPVSRCRLMQRSACSMRKAVGGTFRKRPMNLVKNRFGVSRWKESNFRGHIIFKESGLGGWHA
jgi:hypothetical protein